ncbi:AMP-binding enzyme [Sphingomonas sp. MMS24-JH45]
MAVQQLGGARGGDGAVRPRRAGADRAVQGDARAMESTHFVRMLKLPEDARNRHDLSSLKAVWHAAAPCPVPVKQAMIDWWGPIVHEYYAGTEGDGFHAISAAEWLTRRLRRRDSPPSRTSVARTASSCRRGARARSISRRRRPQRTRAALSVSPTTTIPEDKSTNPQGWTTLGDVGWLDKEGYLYLTDRKSFMIISGGVNIYPAEIENLLVTHPKVADVAVIGAPHEEMGEGVASPSCSRATWTRRARRSPPSSPPSRGRTSATSRRRDASTSAPSCRATTPASSTSTRPARRILGEEPLVEGTPREPRRASYFNFGDMIEAVRRRHRQPRVALAHGER